MTSTDIDETFDNTIAYDSPISTDQLFHFRSRCYGQRLVYRGACYDARVSAPAVRALDIRTA